MSRGTSIPGGAILDWEILAMEQDITGRSIRFQNPDSTWGEWIYLPTTDSTSRRIALEAKSLATEAKELAARGNNGFSSSNESVKTIIPQGLEYVGMPLPGFNSPNGIYRILMNENMELRPGDDLDLVITADVMTRPGHNSGHAGIMNIMGKVTFPKRFILGDKLDTAEFRRFMESRGAKQIPEIYGSFFDTLGLFVGNVEEHHGWIWNGNDWVYVGEPGQMYNLGATDVLTSLFYLKTEYVLADGTTYEPGLYLLLAAGNAEANYGVKKIKITRENIMPTNEEM